MDRNDAPAAEPLVPGYVTERCLGHGTSSSVYALRNEHSGELLALKLLEPGHRGAVADELLPGLEHEFLLITHALVETDRGPGLLLEYAPGGSAARLLAVRGPLQVGEAVTVCAPIAAALAYLHGEGVVHGDVSPANILFTAEGMPKLADLGLRAVLGRITPDGGTPGFLAPETGGARSGLLQPARDVYALGAVLWYLLTGRTPGATRQRPPLSTLLPGIPVELVELIETCLEENPELRPPAADVARRIFNGTTARPIELEDVVGEEDLGLMATVLTGERAPRLAWIRRRGTLRRRGQRRRPTAGGRRAARTPVVPGMLLGVLVLAVIAVAGYWMISSRGSGNAQQVISLPSPAALSATSTASPASERTSAPATGSAPTSAPPTPTPPTHAPSVHAPSTAPNPTPGAAGHEAPEVALVRLTALRDAALASGNAVLLQQVHAAGSPALAHDQLTIAALKDRGLRFTGLETVLSQLEAERPTAEGGALISARSTQLPYRVQDAGGQVMLTAARESSAVRFELHLQDEGWLIWKVSSAD